MEKVLEIQNLKVFFFTKEGVGKAVNGVNFHIKKGEILAVVGESGCGKSVTALSILGLIPYPGKIVNGDILLHGKNLLRLSRKRMQQIRGDRISMIFQDPMIALNPAFTIGNQLMEAMQAHRKVSKPEARSRIIEMLHAVDIPDPEKRIRAYPHQLSGGLRQRVMIAEALLLDPDVLLADEPTTALDVTVQAQTLEVMYRLVKKTGTAIMLITHNLGLVAEAANRVVVMYAGTIVEEGKTSDIFEDPKHPYTKGLLKSIPIIGQAGKDKYQPLFEMSGMVPSLFDLPSGCSFHSRCPNRKEECEKKSPPWLSIDSRHRIRCWLYS